MANSAKTGPLGPQCKRPEARRLAAPKAAKGSQKQPRAGLMRVLAMLKKLMANNAETMASAQAV